MRLRPSLILPVNPVMPRASRGMTLIELMIGLAILAFLMLSGAPAFGDWIRNTQIRGASESILNGIQLARSEAVRRNTVARFQLTDTLDNGCVISTTGRNWLVNMGRAQDPKGKCDATLALNEDDPKDAPYILQRNALNASLMVRMDRPVAFNGMGQQTSVGGLAVASVNITVRSSQGTCVEDGGTVRCLRIVVGTDGQTRMCDPGLKKSNVTQPAECTS